MSDIRRSIPRTDVLLSDPRLTKAVALLGRDRVKDTIAAAQNAARNGRIRPEHVVHEVMRTLPQPGPRRVFNATGILLHTNLGRAPLSAAARLALEKAAGTTDVELDLKTGRRGSRGRTVTEALARAVPDAESVHVVNNNAAAMALAATCLAAGREIVISRGQFVEIGDGFRLPELLESTGARLREIGTTNRTHLHDYADAIGPETGFVLNVHPSNYRIEGFTCAPSLPELAALCTERSVPLVGDLGSGLLAHDPVLPEEPDAATWLRAGVDLVTCSGDKLLGGPQCGLLLGRVDLLDRLRRHPLARALRVDKLTLAALGATLGTATPVQEFLHAAPEDLLRRAERMADDLRSEGIKVSAGPSESLIGGGGAPGIALPSFALFLDARLAEALRLGDPAVLGRVERDQLLLDLRAVPAAEDRKLLAAVVAACK